MENKSDKESSVQQTTEQPEKRKQEEAPSNTTKEKDEKEERKRKNSKISGTLVKISETSQLALKEEEEGMELLQSIPFLKFINQTNEKASFEKLINLLTEMTTLSYDSAHKYEISWKVLCIGNLMECMLPAEITSDIGLKDFTPLDQNRIKIYTLSEKQQWLLFKVSRNIVADGFHIFYAADVEKFAKAFIELAKGNNIFSTVSELNVIVNNFSRDKSLKKIVSSPPSLEKLFNQTAYFLQRSENFLKDNRVEAAIMAFVAVGNCARAFNRIKMFDKQTAPGKTMAALADARAQLTHFTKPDALEGQLNSFIKDTQPRIKEFIGKVEQAAQVCNCTVDIDRYLKQEAEKTPDSPRAYYRT